MDKDAEKKQEEKKLEKKLDKSSDEKKQKETLIFVVSALLIICIAVASVLLIQHNRSKKANATTVPSIVTTTIEPFLLLSTIDHDFVDKEVIGRVESEDLGISCNLIFGTSDDCLRLGAGLHTTSSIPGYSTPPIIAGHVQTVFKGFDKAEVGKTITVKMPYGDYVYKISKIEIINKDDFDFAVIDKPIKQCLFYTCYPFGKVNYVKTQRLFLYCDYVSGQRIFDDIHNSLTPELSSVYESAKANTTTTTAITTK